jgi:hypothetical protein
VIPASTATTLFTSGTITVNVKGDQENRAGRDVHREDHQVTNATMADREAVATIVNDDGAPLASTP